MVKAPLLAVFAAVVVVGGCVDTGAAPRNRYAEARDLQAVIEHVVEGADWEAVSGERVIGAGCSLLDCVVVERDYRVGETAADCEPWAALLTEVSDTSIETRLRGDGSCSSITNIDGIYVSVVMSEAHAHSVEISARYPGRG